MTVIMIINNLRLRRRANCNDKVKF